MTWVYTGKQIVYHALQKASDDIGPEGIAAIKAETDELRSQIHLIKADEKKARASLSALQAKPRISELQQDIQRLENDRDEIQERLARLHGPGTVQISPDERAKLEHEWKLWQRQAAVRRRICRDLWERCTEVLPENTTSSELWV